MDVIIETLFETEWGIIILGSILVIALLIEFFGKNSKN